MCAKRFLKKVLADSLVCVDANVPAEAQGHPDRMQSSAQVPTMKRDAFPLPTFGPKLRELAAEVSHGRGFQIMRGVPVERYAGCFPRICTRPLRCNRAT